MFKRKLLLIIVLIWILTACQRDDLPIPVIDETDPSTPTIAPTAPIAASNTPENPDESAPVLPTLESTTEPSVVPTNTITPAPTNTPIPSSPVDSIRLESVIEGAFNRPIYLTHAYDERLFVVEQAGVIHILENGQLLGEPFLDIRDRVGSSQLEQGLLGIAFHPNYQNNGRFFTHYTDKGGNSQISSFRVSNDSPKLADPNSEVILLTVNQPYPNHNSGQIAFGPDGYLYIGFGDGGSANDPLGSGQDPNTFLGTILRLDVDHSPDSFAIPASNPFTSDDSKRNEIWALGLRNPWRFSFDRLTGDLFIADVGQNIWEEVHFQPHSSLGGENYGWNILEGSHCFLVEACDKTGLELPIFEYDHQEGCSITGGYLYRGSQFPSLYGNYFVADFCRGNIWRLYQNSDDTWSSVKVLESDFVISSFGEDVNGEIYVVVHDSGSIYQLQP